MNRGLNICVTALLLAWTTALFAPGILAQAKDACAVIAAADVEAVLGEPVRSPQRESHSSTVLQASSCRFLPSQSSGKMVSVTAFQFSEANDPASSTPMSVYLKATSFANARQISGVGVDAAWGSVSLAGKLICQMAARKNKSTWITVLFTGLPDDADTFNRAKTFANQILQNFSD